MHSRAKRFLAVATAAASLGVAAPATAAAETAAPGPCQAKPLGTHSELGQIVAVTGVYRGPADAVEVRLTCGVVVDGATVARVTDKLAGPVAALADVLTVGGGAPIPCYEIVVRHLGGAATYYDTCP